MFRFGRSDHAFRASPLSPAVPLDGTETVVGLRQLDMFHRTQHLNSRLEATTRRAGYERYQGPYLHQLTVDHLRRPKPLWPAFLYNANGPGGWRDAYNCPEHLGMLQERMEENFVYYLVNYVQILGFLAVLIIYARPLTLIGLIFIGLSLYVNLLHVANTAAQTGDIPAADVDFRSPTAQDSDPMAILRTFLVVVTWFVVAQTRCLPALSSWVLYSFTLVGGHAALRIARSEYRCKVRPGVPLKDVLGLERGDVRHPDPRRVFREAWQQISLQANIAYEYANATAGHYWWRLRSAVYEQTGFRI